jgi:hypothetical protein
MSSAPDGVNHTEMEVDRSPPHSFEELLASKADSLPPPGQAYYEARKALWLAGRPETTDSDRAAGSTMSPTRERLHTLLTSPDAEHSDRVWSGVAKVWRGLNAGSRLRQALPLPLLVRI